MGTNDEETVFLTQDEQELYLLQQLQIESGESFDYKKGYDFSIFEVHKQYNLRSKKNVDVPNQTKKTVQNQPKKIKEAPVSKILQILPRENPKPSSPTIVDITSNQPHVDQPSTSIPPEEPVDKAQNIRFENPHKEIPNKGKEDKPTQIPTAKIQNLQTKNVSLPFYLGTKIAKLKISVPLT